MKNKKQCPACKNTFGSTHRSGRATSILLFLHLSLAWQEGHCANSFTIDTEEKEKVHSHGVIDQVHKGARNLLKWILSQYSEAHTSKLFSVLDIPRAGHKHSTSGNHRQGWGTQVPLTRECVRLAGCICGWHREGPASPYLLVEEYSAHKICPIFPWDHSVIWHYGQVAALSLCHRLLGAIEAQQFEVILLQTLSPHLGILPWKEKVGLATADSLGQGTFTSGGDMCGSHYTHKIKTFLVRKFSVLLRVKIS